jgi:hypothetical protein
MTCHLLTDGLVKVYNYNIFKDHSLQNNEGFLRDVNECTPENLPNCETLNSSTTHSRYHTISYFRFPSLLHLQYSN